MPVHFSPSSKTSLAEAELEYNEEHRSPSLYLGLPVIRGNAQVSHTCQRRRAVFNFNWCDFDAGRDSEYVLVDYERPDEGKHFSPFASPRLVRTIK